MLSVHLTACPRVKQQDLLQVLMLKCNRIHPISLHSYITSTKTNNNNEIGHAEVIKSMSWKSQHINCLLPALVYIHSSSWLKQRLPWFFVWPVNNDNTLSYKRMHIIIIIYNNPTFVLSFLLLTLCLAHYFDRIMNAQLVYTDNWIWIDGLTHKWTHLITINMYS